MHTVIIDYGSGNIRSAAKAFQHAAADKGTVRVITEASALKNATHIVLPGVGAFADCMRGLNQLPSMIAALEEEVLEKRKPFLGICVGMQLLADRGYENGEHKGLGWIKGEVRNLKPEAGNLKVPHMGWNELKVNHPHPLLRGMGNGEHAYFVHSYHFMAAERDTVIATTQYGTEIAAILAKGNILGTQFHPEKSQEVGLKLIGNFLNL